MLDAVRTIVPKLSDLPGSMLSILEERGSKNYALWKKRLDEGELETWLKNPYRVPADALPLLARCCNSPNVVFSPFIAAFGDWQIAPEPSPLPPHSQLLPLEGFVTRLMSLDCVLSSLSGCLVEALQSDSLCGTSLATTERFELAARIGGMLPRLLNLKGALVGAHRFGAWSRSMIASLKESQQIHADNLVPKRTRSWFCKCKKNAGLPADFLPILASTEQDPYRVLGPFVEAAGWRLVGRDGTMSDQNVTKQWLLIRGEYGNLCNVVREVLNAQHFPNKPCPSINEREALASALDNLIIELVNLEKGLIRNPAGSAYPS
jgi:hypothetical protein